MCIAAYAGDAFDSEVEWKQLEFTTFTLAQTGLLKVRNNKTAQTAVHMKANLVGCSEVA